jgi:hypothetical protein
MKKGEALNENPSFNASPLRGMRMDERVQITLPTRFTALTLPARDGIGLEELMQLERADGYWLFEDGDVIVIASRTLSLPARSLALTLPSLEE